jgi:uncharacterized protein
MSTHGRKFRLKKCITISFITLIILAVIGVLGVSSYVGWQLTHPARKALAVPTMKPNKYSDVEFMDIKNAVTLKGWYFKTPGSDKTVILAHGFRQNRLQFDDKTYNMINSLQQKGYSVLAFDFRDCGDSGGSFTSVGLFEKDDLIGAVDYVKKAQGAKHVVLLGFSMGASTSIIAGAECKDVDAVIADSPFADLKTYLEENLPVWSNLPAVPFTLTTLFATRLETGVDTSKVSPKKEIVNLAPRPLLLIQSKDDDKIPVSNSEELYSIYKKAAGSSAEFWETSKVGHVGSYDGYPVEYMNTVFTFLDKVYNGK